MGAVSWYKLVDVCTTCCQKEGILLQKYRDRNGGVSRYFSNVLGPGVNLTLLNLAAQKSHRKIADDSDHGGCKWARGYSAAEIAGVFRFAGRKQKSLAASDLFLVSLTNRRKLAATMAASRRSHAISRLQWPRDTKISHQKVLAPEFWRTYRTFLGTEKKHIKNTHIKN